MTMSPIRKELNEEGTLSEMFFDRDEFGRYVFEGARGDREVNVTIWPK